MKLLREKEREEAKQWKSTTFKHNINSVVEYKRMSIEKPANQERDSTMLSFQKTFVAHVCKR